MDWTQVLTIAGTNIALYLYSTRQARTDFLHLDRKLEENRRETQAMVKESHNMIKAIKEESRAFQERLCKIQEGKIG